MKKQIIRILIWAIRKYAPEGIDTIEGQDGSVIAYRWAWSIEVEKLLFRKRRTP